MRSQSSQRYNKFDNEAINAINSLHVSWIYFNPESRKKYKLQNCYAYYHSETNIDQILRLEKELQRLQLKSPDDYSVSENIFGEWNIYTLALSEKASEVLEKMGIKVTEKFS